MATPLSIIPEVILMSSIKNGLAAVKANFLNNAATDSWLFKSLNGIQVGSYDFYEQAKQLIINPNNDPRNLLVDLHYDMAQRPVPAVVIANKSETPSSAGQWLSIGQGYILPEDMDATGAIPAIYTRRKNATTSLVILSDNANEVLMLYHLLTGVLLSLQVDLNLKGIESISFGGEESPYYTAQLPLFNKALVLNYDYNFSAAAIPEVFN